MLWAAYKSEKTMGKVYFFHNGEWCKIGQTTPELKKRLWQAHVWSPRPLTIVGYIETDFPELLEKQIHRELVTVWKKKPSGKGEWFDLTIAEATRVIKEHQHGKIKHQAHSNAPGHPSHSVRQIRRGQQHQTQTDGEVQHRQQRRDCFARVVRVFASIGTEHGLGGSAFLRKT
jgi:hypothetical protein